MTAALDISGMRFGRLVAVGRASSSRGGKARWWCRCDCGTGVAVAVNGLKSGNTRSCGCLRADLNTERLRRHGGTGTLEYDIYQSLIRRCMSPGDASFARYGGRGITVCGRWLGSGGFVNFMSDMGERPSTDYSVDRRDNDGPYSPENCRWATQAQQNRNKRTTIMCDAAVSVMRHMAARRAQTKDLAWAFGVSIGHVQNIVRRKAWA